jgi:hypothetical protein
LTIPRAVFLFLFVFDSDDPPPFPTAAKAASSVMDYDRGGGGYGYSSQGASRGSAIRGPSMERGGGGGYGHHQPAPVGIAPVFRGGSAHRDEYGNGGQYGAPHGGGYGSSASPASSGVGRGGGSGGDARSAQINEYVAKQKAAKQNAPLIRKVSQQHAPSRRGEKAGCAVAAG